MTEDEFWKHIQSSHDESDGDMDAKSELIRSRVSSLQADQGIVFSRHFEDLMDRSYSWDLWAAAYIAHGGCSDDTFTDFRASLISRGKLAFETALRTPDALALEQFDEETWFYEGFQYAVSDGVERSVGELLARASPNPAEPTGQPWDEDDEEALKKRLPNLWARHKLVTTEPELHSKPSQKNPWWKFW